MWFFTHRNDDQPTTKLLPFAGYKILQAMHSVNGLQHSIYTLLRSQRGYRLVCRENHAGLAANLRLQFSGDTADGQCRVIHFAGFNQMGKSLCLIQHSIDVLRRRQILRFSPAWNEAHLLAFGNMLDDQRSRLALNFTG